MILFTEMIFNYKDVMGVGEKNPKEKRKRKKNPRLVALPSPFYDMEAGCFSVSENAENKPDLLWVGGRSNLMGQKKKAESGAVWTGSMNLFWWGSKIFRKCGLE